MDTVKPSLTFRYAFICHVKFDSMFPWKFNLNWLGWQLFTEIPKNEVSLNLVFLCQIDSIRSILENLWCMKLMIVWGKASIESYNRWGLGLISNSVLVNILTNLTNLINCNVENTQLPSLCITKKTRVSLTYELSQHSCRINPIFQFFPTVFHIT